MQGTTDIKEGTNILRYYTHTYTHTQIYIYIYIFWKIRDCHPLDRKCQ